jgi:hypothetical protein
MTNSPNFDGIPKGLPVPIQAALAATTEWGRHRPAVFVPLDDLRTNLAKPEYQILADYDPERSGYWILVEPLPKPERTKLIPYYGDPGDEHPE